MKIRTDVVLVSWGQTGLRVDGAAFLSGRGVIPLYHVDLVKVGRLLGVGSVAGCCTTLSAAHNKCHNSAAKVKAASA